MAVSIGSKKVLATINHLNDHLELKLNFLQKTEFAFLLAVSLIRQDQGFFSTKKQNTLATENVKSYVLPIQELMAPISLPVTEERQNDLIQTIFWFDFGWDNAEEEARIERLCNQTLTLMTDALGIGISDLGRKNCIALLKAVYVSYKVYPYEKHIAYNRDLYNSLTVQRDFAVFTKVLEKTLRDQEAKTRFPWYSMYFHPILFKLFIYWDDLPEQLDALRKPVATEVCSDLGAKHAQFLAYYLKKNYHDKVLLDVQADKIYAEVAPESLVSDLYVTNFSTPEIPEERLFVVEDVPSAKNLSALGRKIEEYRMVTLIKQLSYLN